MGRGGLEGYWRNGGFVAMIRQSVRAYNFEGMHLNLQARGRGVIETPKVQEKVGVVGHLSCMSRRRV